MLTVKQLFIADGLDIEEDDIARPPCGPPEPPIQRIVAEGHFDRYQREQVPTVNPFHLCKVLLSFLGLENNKAEFTEPIVNGSRPFKRSDWDGMPDWLLDAHKYKVPRIYYDLEEILNTTVIEVA